MAQPDAAIEAEGLRKAFGDVQALDGIDLSAPPGTILGLLGPNGAGKTTAVRILTTLLPPDGGSARVAGLDVVRDATELRSRIGLAGQYAAVDENLSGFENLEMVGRLYRLGKAPARERERELLERFSLTEAADRLAKTYSGGMRRRLDLAAALVARPPVLFLDGPTTGLDPRSRIQLWETIEARVAAGTTVLLTTQYLDEADRLADRIAVIDHGRVIAEGTPDELKSRVGGERLEVTLESYDYEAAAIEALAPLADGRPKCEHGILVMPLDRSRGGIARRCGAWTPRRWASRTSRCAARRSTTCSSCSRATRPRSPRRRRRRRPPELARLRAQRHRRGGEAQPAAHPAPAGPVGLLHDPADHVRAAVRVRVRRRETMSFGGFVTAIGLSDDLRKGLIDRFRSLPMARSAVLAGRTLADVATNMVSLVVMVVVGLLVGFNFSSAPLEIAAGIGLLLLFGYAFSWAFAFVALVSNSAEGAQALGFMLIFPLTFASSAFVPPESMPSWLEAFAEANPFSTIVDAVRALFVDAPAGNDVWAAVAWCVGLIAVFATLSVYRYRRAVSS